MSKIIKIEVLIASPPTSRCQKLIGIMEEIVRRYPDKSRLGVFTRGMETFPEKPSVTMEGLMRKGSVIPACVVENVCFSSAQVPELEEMEAKVQKAILSAGGE